MTVVWRRFGLLATTIVVMALVVDEALAQAVRHPFAVGAQEAPVGAVSGVMAWLLAQESAFYLHLKDAIHAVAQDRSAIWLLFGLSFAYGVVHAAGPGHGKAVIASYIVANERALYRGMLLALAAALLQGLLAIVLVVGLTAIFGTLVIAMARASAFLEIASASAIVLFGAYLVVAKGRAILAALRSSRRVVAADTVLAFAPAGALGDDATSGFGFQAPAGLSPSRGQFTADDCSEDHLHGPDCGHLLALDAVQRDGSVDWRQAAVAVLTAAARPCSGAILVLVFASAQGFAAIGIGAVVAMSLGTAVTTGALAAFAVFAKQAAMKIVGTSTRRVSLAVRTIELGAALAVLLFGVLLLAATFAFGGIAIGVS